MSSSQKAKPEQNSGVSQMPKAKRIYRSAELFQNDREVLIVHGDASYRLQITKAGKLILNK